MPFVSIDSRTGFPVRDTGVGFLPLIMGAVSLATGVYSSIKKQKEEKKAKEKAEEAAAAAAAKKAAEAPAKAGGGGGGAKIDPSLIYILGGVALFLVTVVAIRD